MNSSLKYGIRMTNKKNMTSFLEVSQSKQNILKVMSTKNLSGKTFMGHLLIMKKNPQFK
jgi:hypothetical protein